MELKVHFPSPYEDGTDIKQWFALMRVALKSAEKTYDELVKDMTPEVKKTLYLRFNNSFMEIPQIKELEEKVDGEYSKSQDIWLEINQI